MNKIKTPKDTGVRIKFDTGSQKEIVEGRGRYDLLPISMIGSLIHAYYDDSLPPDDPNIENARAIDDFLYNIHLSFLREDTFDKISVILNATNIFISEFLATTPEQIIPALAKLYEAGANKYAARDWEKGRPQEVFIDSALRHFFQFLNDETDEAHDIAVIWNLISCADTLSRMPELAYTIPVYPRTNK